MNICEGCGCSVWDRITLENGQKVCSYCEAAYDKAKAAEKAANKPKPREYNNLVWLLKQSHKTVRNWAKLHGFSHHVVEMVLNKNGVYSETDIHKMSEQHFNIIMALCDEGHQSTLVGEGYVTRV